MMGMLESFYVLEIGSILSDDEHLMLTSHLTVKSESISDLCLRGNENIYFNCVLYLDTEFKAVCIELLIKFEDYWGKK